jgi:threonine synthase
VLDVRYDYASASRSLKDQLAEDRSDPHVFRYWPVLPVANRGADKASASPSISRTGGTPLVSCASLARRCGVDSLWIKDETQNPSGCLKDRASALAVEMALSQGLGHAFCASAGNAAVSLAFYCDRVGLACHVFVPRGIAPYRLEALRGYHADVHVSSGDYDQAYDEALMRSQGEGWYNRSCAWNPFLVEGKKTVSFEIGEQLGWQVPEVVVAPVGDGCTLGAIGKGFRELKHLGLTYAIPRLIGVQSEAVQPLVHRFHGTPRASAPGSTRATSIAVNRPRNALRVIEEVRASEGDLVAVPDEETARAQELLLSETGVHAEFSSATALAGLLRLAQSGSLRAGSAVLVVTGRSQGS